MTNEDQRDQRNSDLEVEQAWRRVEDSLEDLQRDVDAFDDELDARARDDEYVSKFEDDEPRFHFVADDDDK